MDNAVYLALSRQSGLARELKVVANNVANMSTTGYRGESVLFAEMVSALPQDGSSISMTDARIRQTDFAQGALRRTGASLDLALDGPGFFMVAGPEGPLLTRAGSFRREADGTLSTPGGAAVLDPGGAPVALPPDASVIEVASDGTVSADGLPVGALAVVTVDDPTALTRRDGVAFSTDAPLVPAEAAVVQGFVESSNVAPVQELARMIEVQRGYELGRELLDREDERVRAAIRVLGQNT